MNARKDGSRTISPDSVTNVINYRGKGVRDVYKASEAVIIAAGDAEPDGPHILRHSCVTLFVKAKVSLPEIAAFAGITHAVLERYYLHSALANQENIAATTPGNTRPKRMKSGAIE